MTINNNTIRVDAALLHFTIEEYVKCPVQLLHAGCINQINNATFWCSLEGKRCGLLNGVDSLRRHFTVPAQTVFVADDPDFGRFSLVQVSGDAHGKRGPVKFQLIINIDRGIGKLFPINVFDLARDKRYRESLESAVA